MHLSDKRLAANRANALKSTGPKGGSTPRISARKARKYDLLAKAVIIGGESATNFLTLIKSIHAEYRPATPTEEGLVQNMAIAQWRLLRAWTLESAAISLEMQRQVGSAAENDNSIRAMLAMRSLSKTSGHPEPLSRYEHRFDVQYHRSLRELNRLKKEKLAQATQLQQNNQPAAEIKPTKTH